MLVSVHHDKKPYTDSWDLAPSVYNVVTRLLGSHSRSDRSNPAIHWLQRCWGEVIGQNRAGEEKNRVFRRTYVFRMVLKYSGKIYRTEWE